MKTAELSPRLVSAADFVRWGAVFADVGTDHAYLPLFLLKCGKIERAVCSDINCGPLNSAMENARDMGFFDKIDFVLTDGAAALYGRGITDLAVCGMGGELIADIVGKADFLRDASVNLILQPMSKQAYLRSFLARSGFSVLSESYTKEGEHAYVTMQVNYSGTPYELTPVEAELGLAAEHITSHACRYYLERRLAALSRAEEGKLSSGAASTPETKLISAIKEILKI